MVDYMLTLNICAVPCLSQSLSIRGLLVISFLAHHGGRGGWHHDQLARPVQV